MTINRPTLFSSSTNNERMLTELELLSEMFAQNDAGYKKFILVRDMDEMYWIYGVSHSSLSWGWGSLFANIFGFHKSWTRLGDLQTTRGSDLLLGESYEATYYGESITLLYQFDSTGVAIAHEVPIYIDSAEAWGDTTGTSDWVWRGRRRLSVGSGGVAASLRARRGSSNNTDSWEVLAAVSDDLVHTIPYNN